MKFYVSQTGFYLILFCIVYLTFLFSWLVVKLAQLAKRVEKLENLNENTEAPHDNSHDETVSPRLSKQDIGELLAANDNVSD